jgi:hypothetical protein
MDFSLGLLKESALCACRFCHARLPAVFPPTVAIAILTVIRSCTTRSIRRWAVNNYCNNYCSNSFCLRNVFWQGDDMTDRFLRIMTNLAVSHSLGNETSAQRPSQLSYLALDAYVRLVVLLVNCKPLPDTLIPLHLYNGWIYRV